MSENKTDTPSTTSEKSYSWVAGANFVASIVYDPYSPYVPLYVNIFDDKS